MAENKSIIIPDASVILKWALSDEVAGVDAALKLQDDAVRGKINLIAPSHCLYEVANTLGRLTPNHAATFMSYLISYRIVEEVPLSVEMSRRALELTKKYKGLSFYDAAYHALAIMLKGVFVTADEKYVRRANSEGSIRLL